MTTKVEDPRILEAEEGDVQAAKDLLIELGYSLSCKEPLSEEISKYFSSKIHKILEGEDANRALNLINRAGRPELSPEIAIKIVNALVDKVEKGKMSLPSAIGRIYTEGRFTYTTKNGKSKSYSEKTLSRIANDWLPSLYPGRLEHWNKTKPWKNKQKLDKK